MTRLRGLIKRVPGAVLLYRGLRRARLVLSDVLGVTTPRPSSSRAYWEGRAVAYRDEVEQALGRGDVIVRAQREFLAELAGIDWDSLLEIGCGFGWHLRAMAALNEGKRLIGGDYSWAQLQQAQGYLAGCRVGLCQLDAFCLPFADAAFDVVLTSGTLMCIHPDDLLRVLGEIRRVSGRYVIAIEYAREHMDTPARRRVMRFAEWYAHSFGDAFHRAGLRVLESRRLSAFDGYDARVPLSYILAQV